MSKVTLRLSWIKYGNIRWEEWYVRQHGRNLKKLAGLSEHVSFANYDLKRNNYPSIIFDEDRLEISDISESDIPNVRQILENHGFQIDPSDLKTELNPPESSVHYHHIYPQQHRPFFQELGINIDQWTVAVDGYTHLRYIHNESEWNRVWQEWINEHKGEVTAEETLQFGRRLLIHFGIEGLWEGGADPNPSYEISQNEIHSKPLNFLSSRDFSFKHFVLPSWWGDPNIIGFRDLFRAAKGREMTENEAKALFSLPQSEVNLTVKQLAQESGGKIATFDVADYRDDTVYTMFTKSPPEYRHRSDNVIETRSKIGQYPVEGYTKILSHPIKIVDDFIQSANQQKAKDVELLLETSTHFDPSSLYLTSAEYRLDVVRYGKPTGIMKAVVSVSGDRKKQKIVIEADARSDWKNFLKPLTFFERRRTGHRH